MTRKAYLAVIPFAAMWAHGCIEGGEIVFYESECFDNPVIGHLDRNGDLDPCCRDQTIPCTDGGIPAPTPTRCDGECRPFAPVDDWISSPYLVWHGPRSGPIPDCPAGATDAAWLGRDPIPPFSCPLCECSDPACVLPDGLIAAPVVGCGLPGPFTPFPPETDGSCSHEASFEPNAVQSVAILPPTVTSCIGSMAPVPKAVTDGSWETVALVCFGKGVGSCDDPHNQACVPSAPPGFTQCVKGNTPGRTEAQCPPEYPNRHVYYRELDWQLSCSPCECSAPVGSICEAEVTAYKSDSCASDSMFLDVIVNPSPGPPPCYTVQPNTALKGLTEAWVVNQPGKCEPVQSVPNGSVQVLDSSAWELCCADPDFPDPDPSMP